MGYKEHVMLINDTINIGQSWLGAGLAPSIALMSKIESSQDNRIDIDLSRFRFIDPVFVISLLVYLSRCGKETFFHNPKDYHSVIHFPTGGFRTDGLRRSNILASMESYAHKSYLPIVNFSASANNDERDIVSGILEDIIIRQLSIPRNIANGFRYMVSETMDNITEHSEAERGYLFAQAYPYYGFLDICIADNGISLLGSYRKSVQIDATSDLEAIRAANERISSKNRPEAENRGFGIYTIKKMLLDGLDGQYMIVSGDSIYVKGRGFDNYYRIPNQLKWKGTIVALRIPYQQSGPNQNFDYTDYLE